jgi:hypothetical protein
MRSSVVIVGALACCGPSAEVERSPPAAREAQPTPSSGEGKYEAPVPPTPAPPRDAAGALAVDHIDLLQPEDVVAQRTDAKTLSALLEPIMSTVVAYSRGLPDEFDVFVAARAGAARIWLASATGDLTVPELERDLAKIPRVAIRSGAVAVAIRFVRGGTEVSPHGKWFLPASWKAAAGQGRVIDVDIDRVGPPL